MALREAARRRSALQASREATMEAEADLEAAEAVEAQARETELPEYLPGEWADVMVLMPRPLLPSPRGDTLESPGEGDSTGVGAQPHARPRPPEASRWWEEASPPDSIELRASLRARCRANRVEWSGRESTNEVEARLRMLACDDSWLTTTFGGRPYAEQLLLARERERD